MADHIHSDTAKAKWFKLSLCEQLGNIGSEVGRATKWKKMQKKEFSDEALKRAFDLLDLTISDDRWKGPKRKEICRAREVISDTFWGENFYHDSAEKLEKYFFQFAYASRKNK